jgi:uncharacterized cupredoxin-like copper-binding protein
MRTTIARVSIAAAMTLGVAAPAAAGTKPSDCATIKATLSEYKIKLNKKTVDAGCVTLKVINRGVEDHEVIVTKAKRPGRLPQHEGVVDEQDIAVIDETGDLATGRRVTLTLGLRRGRYVLFCNVLHEHADEETTTTGGHGHDEAESEHAHGEETTSESHFGEGMHVILTVR